MALTRLERFDPALGKRLATGATLGVIAIVDLLLGGWYFAVLVIVAALIMADEWADLSRAPGDRAVRLVRLAAAAVPALAIVATMSGSPALGLAMIGLGAVLAAGCAALVPTTPVDRAAFGALYIGLPCLCLVWLRNFEPGGFSSVLWLLLVVWGTDVGAYFAGRSIGGPKLAPAISPSKTWAGLGGGMAAAALLGAIAAPANLGLGWLGLGWVGVGWSALFGAVLAVVAQAGDLFESHLKRRAAVKDSGRLLPGHGGLLDRVDGLLFAAPAYALVHLWRVA
jgi:phosphatidate cytidylyltransferase